MTQQDPASGEKVSGVLESFYEEWRMGVVLKCRACGTDNPVDSYDPVNPPYCDTCFGVLRSTPEKQPQTLPAAACALGSQAPASAEPPPTPALPPTAAPA